MKYLNNFHNNNLIITLCDKSQETYDFISKYLDTISYADYIENSNLFQVCCYDSTKLVGLRVFRMKDNKIHLNYTAIEPEYRSLGINQMMLDKIVEVAKQESVVLITSNVRQSNTKSIESLLSSGFSINDKVDMTYPDGEKKIPMYYKIN